jgi:hypothetical protein
MDSKQNSILEVVKMIPDLESDTKIQMTRDLESDTGIEIIRENRYTLDGAGFVKWVKNRLEAMKAAFAYTVHENGNLIYQDVLCCNGVVSVCQLVLYGILIGLQPIPLDTLVMVKTTEMAVINGINGDLDFWIANNWYTKSGSTVKYRDLWEELYNERQKRQIVALPLETPEALRLQGISKAFVLRN